MKLVQLFKALFKGDAIDMIFFFVPDNEISEETTTD